MFFALPNKKITTILLQYANSRLYDTVKSKYVTLDQLAGMIRKENRVEVFDAKTEIHQKARERKILSDHLRWCPLFVVCCKCLKMI
jgi:hypothetical protein